MPADAWSGDELARFHARAKRFFPRKAWWFAPDAMASFKEQNNLLARHLTDSQHMARQTKDYLGISTAKITIGASGPCRAG